MPEVNAQNRAEIIGENMNFAASEAYKLLRTNLMFSLPDEGGCRIIGITSAIPAEGKSTTTLNLAYVLAQAGKSVLVIEADMRLPTYSTTLSLQTAPGLSNVLAGLSQFHEAIQPSGLLDNLFVVVAGDIPPNPSELLGSSRFGDALAAYAAKVDFIIVDLPPVLSVSDAATIAPLVQGFLVITRQNYDTKRNLREALRQLGLANSKILGFVVTRAGGGGGGHKYYKKGYGYGYGYGYGEQPKSKKDSKSQK